jgi:hypothetical protein
MGLPAKYPPEFRQEAVELVLGSGRSINEVALSLGFKRGRPPRRCPAGDAARHLGRHGVGIRAARRRRLDVTARRPGGRTALARSALVSPRAWRGRAP